MPEDNPLFTTTFIGNRGVGKTSLLSAMYMALDDANLPCGLSLITKTPDEFLLLKKKWQEMKHHIRKQEFGATIQRPLYQGSQGFTCHDFILTGNPSDDSTGIPFRIWDTAGGDTANANVELVNTVANSFAVMCAVDATFLMECDSDVNEEMNEVRSIKQILNRALEQDNRIRTVFFLLTKCEKYVQTPAGRDDMAQKFNEGFRSILKFLHQKKVNVFYLPVQTMGCVELARMEECDDGTWSQVFQVSLSKKFDASDAVHPLSLLLQICIYILDLVQQEEWENRSIWEKIWDTITFKEAPAQLGGLVAAIADHFGQPKDLRTNKGGDLSEVVVDS